MDCPVLDAAADAPLQVLHEVFGYAAFRGAQREIVDHVSAGGDALVLMPTGGGKITLLPGAGARCATGRSRAWRWS